MNDGSEQHATDEISPIVRSSVGKTSLPSLLQGAGDYSTPKSDEQQVGDYNHRDILVHTIVVMLASHYTQSNFSGFGSLGESPIPYSESCRNARVGAKSNTKHTGLRISSSFGSSPLGFLIDQGDCTRNAD